MREVTEERRRDDRAAAHHYTGMLYRKTCLPDRQEQAQTLEKLRYKWGGYKTGLRIMQVVGDFLRQYIPVPPRFR